MQGFVKFIFTIYTTVSIFFSNLIFPATIYPESENFDFL